MLLIESQYFPTLVQFVNLCQETHVEIEQYEFFKKGTFRNRCTIAGSNGLINLTVPIRGGREQKVLMKDVEIREQENWRVRHVRSIRSAYASAPFFDFYFDDVSGLIMSGTVKLLQLNLDIFNWIVSVLKLDLAISITAAYPPHQFLPSGTNIDTPVSTADAVGLSLRYHQVFEEKFGFRPGLSILDLLFNEGPNSIHLLRSASDARF